MLNNLNQKNKKRSMKEYSTDERLRICNRCPIYSPSTRRCNSNLWLNPDTNEVSTTYKSGYIRGCNCIVTVKARNSFNHCVAGKW